MCSISKYVVILVVGTISSIFAGCNCSVKEDENDEKNKDIEESQELKIFKNFICSCFSIYEEDIIFISLVNEGEIASTEGLNNFINKS